jgi:hypothetical protein
LIDHLDHLTAIKEAEPTQVAQPSFYDLNLFPRVSKENVAEYQTRQLARAWLNQSAFDITRIEADGNQIKLTISRCGYPPPLSDMATNLQAVLDPLSRAKTEIVPSQILLYLEPASDKNKERSVPHSLCSLRL